MKAKLLSFVFASLPFLPFLSSNSPPDCIVRTMMTLRLPARGFTAIRRKGKDRSAAMAI
jgi:hypothetical protein